MIELRWRTPAEWLVAVEADVVAFLQDHAGNERKVAQSALGLAVEHPARPELVARLIPLAQEELDHFRRVWELLAARGATLGVDRSVPYVGALRRAVRQADIEEYLLGRLVAFAIIEARGHERFAILAEGLRDPDLRRFYVELTRAEARHQTLYLTLAERYFEPARVAARLDPLLDLEARVAREQPLRAALY